MTSLLRIFRATILRLSTSPARPPVRRRPHCRLTVETLESRLAPASAVFTPLGFYNSDAVAVSADGAVVVGHDQVTGQVYRWTQAAGAISLGFGDRAIDTSANGTVVVGWTNTPGGREAYRWTPADGRVGLGDLAGGAFDSLGYGVSADGSVVVGDADDGTGRAFRWTQATGMQALPHYQEYAGQTIFHSIARKVNTDGSIVAGYTSLGEGVSAVRWVDGTPDYLGDLPGAGRFSDAYAISGDGSTVVGWSNGTSEGGTGFQAFRWTEATGMVGLGDLPGGAGLFRSIAFGVSDDGSVIVGSANFNAEANAFLWSQAGGMVDLKGLLEGTYGLNLTGWQLTEAWDISPDGRTIVGRGTNPAGQDEAWRVQLFNNEAPTLDVPDAQTAYEDVDKAMTGVTVNDSDGDNLTVTLGVGHGTLNLGTTTGLTVTGNARAAVTLSGSIADLNAALASLVYRGNLNFSGGDTLSVSARDGALTTNDSFSIAVKSTAQQSADLQAKMNDLRNAGVLNHGRCNSLVVKLNLKGNSGDVDKVQSFLGHVRDFLMAGILTQAQADDLTMWGSILLLSVTRR